MSKGKHKRVPKIFGGTRKRVPTVRAKKIGRNEPCPCLSGKKYKRCCEGRH